MSNVRPVGPERAPLSFRALHARPGASIVTYLGGLGPSRQTMAASHTPAAAAATASSAPTSSQLNRSLSSYQAVVSRAPLTRMGLAAHTRACVTRAMPMAPSRPSFATSAGATPTMPTNTAMAAAACPHSLHRGWLRVGSAAHRRRYVRQYAGGSDNDEEEDDDHEDHGLDSTVVGAGEVGDATDDAIARKTAAVATAGAAASATAAATMAAAVAAAALSSANGAPAGGAAAARPGSPIPSRKLTPEEQEALWDRTPGPKGDEWETVEHRLRHSPTLGSHFTPAQMLNPFDDHPIVGGEGVQYILSSRQHKGPLMSGYWAITLLATRGRAFPATPLAIYCAYAAVVITALMTNMDSVMPHKDAVTGIQQAVNMIGVALFFLMGFRTNSSYDRWYEARRLWGNVSASLASIAAMLAAGSIKSKTTAQSILRWSVMYAICLKHAMRNEEVLDEARDVVISPTELADLRAQQVKQRPIYCCMRAWGAINQAFTNGDAVVGASDINRLRIQVERMMETIPAMGRIMGTPMPFAYVVHLRSFMVVWLSAMPIIYTPSLQWGALPVTFFIGYALLGMEAISLEVEKPMERDFNDLPLDDLVDAACSSALELCKDFDLVVASHPSPK